MGKDPAFLFYPGDWMGGTTTLSRFLKGCYMDVLIAQFNGGHLSIEEIKTVLGSDFGQAWPTIQKKFKADLQGLFFNEKLESEILKRQEYSKGRASNRRKKTHETDMLNICNTHVLHMENENENVITSLKSTIELDVLKNERFMADLNNAHKGKDILKAWNECWTHHIQRPNYPKEAWEWRQKLNTWLTIKRIDISEKQSANPYKVQ